MSNVMTLKGVCNKPSRNGFDLSTKRNFTAKCGELLPNGCWEVLPGDKFQIDLRAFARTQPLNTSAYARIREYYDFFYVPFSQLWNRTNDVLTQMDYNNSHATALVPNFSAFNGELPYITQWNIGEYIHALATASDFRITKNFFGYNRAELSCKLLEYLGYGDYSGYITKASGGNLRYNLDLNVFGLLAYQKIYADFYRDQQWERPNPSSFNVDYMNGSTSMNVSVPPSAIGDFYDNYNFFDLRYCNWQKDLYHGILPNPQYGDSSVVPLSATSGEFVYNVGSFSNNSALSSGQKIPQTTGSFGISPVASTSGFSILALRQYEFLQKWKEIAQANDQNYKDQTKAMWGVDVSDLLANRVQYLGGINTSLDINEVVNTNITGSYAADIAGFWVFHVAFPCVKVMVEAGELQLFLREQQPGGLQHENAGVLRFAKPPDQQIHDHIRRLGQYRIIIPYRQNQLSALVLQRRTVQPHLFKQLYRRFLQSALGQCNPYVPHHIRSSAIDAPTRTTAGIPRCFAYSNDCAQLSNTLFSAICPWAIRSVQYNTACIS